MFYCMVARKLVPTGLFSVHADNGKCRHRKSGSLGAVAEGHLLCRERASSMYAVLPFGIATGLVEVPYLLLQSALFVPIMYFAVGFRMSVDAFILFVVIFTGQRPCLTPSEAAELLFLGCIGSLCSPMSSFLFFSCPNRDDDKDNSTGICLSRGRIRPVPSWLFCTFPSIAALT
jgi:hypothetical protein